MSSEDPFLQSSVWTPPDAGSVGVDSGLLDEVALRIGLEAIPPDATAAGGITKDYADATYAPISVTGITNTVASSIVTDTTWGGVGGADANGTQVKSSTYVSPAGCTNSLAISTAGTYLLLYGFIGCGGDNTTATTTPIWMSVDHISGSSPSDNEACVVPQIHNDGTFIVNTIATAMTARQVTINGATTFKAWWRTDAGTDAGRVYTNWIIALQVS